MERELKNRLSKRERLDAILQSFYGGNKTNMANAFGVSQQAICAMFQRETLNTIKIYELHPEISAHWLLTGEGEMMKVTKWPRLENGQWVKETECE